MRLKSLWNKLTLNLTFLLWDIGIIDVPEAESWTWRNLTLNIARSHRNRRIELHYARMKVIDNLIDNLYVAEGSSEPFFDFWQRKFNAVGHDPAV